MIDNKTQPKSRCIWTNATSKSIAHKQDINSIKYIIINTTRYLLGRPDCFCDIANKKANGNAKYNATLFHASEYKLANAA